MDDLVELLLRDPADEVDLRAVVLLELLGERDELDALELEVGGERGRHRHRPGQRDLVADDLDEELLDGAQDGGGVVGHGLLSRGTRVQAITWSPSRTVSATISPIVRRSPWTAVTSSLRGSVIPVRRALATASLAVHSRASHSSAGRPAPSATSAGVNATACRLGLRGSTRSTSMPTSSVGLTIATARSSLCATEARSAPAPAAATVGAPDAAL